MRALLQQIRRHPQLWLLGFVCGTAPAAEPPRTNSAPDKVLLLDSLGRVVQVSTNEIDAKFLPPPNVGLKQQVPHPTEGSSQPREISDRSRDAAGEGFRWFPSVPPPLAPYLASQDEYGNTALRPGPLFANHPLEHLVQDPKYWLSQYGFRYKLRQTFTFASLSDVMQGDNNLGFYTLNFVGAWSVYDSPADGTAGWLRTRVDVKSGLGTSGETQDARKNLGTITDPTGLWNSVNGVRVPELAWQQSLFDGRFVAIAGMVDQSNFIDQNAYAQSGRGQFINSALSDTQVMPVPKDHFGLNLQWQPRHEFYALSGFSVGNNPAGHPPWTDLNLDNWSLLWEFGYAPKDVLGLGPGIYRVQPFLAEVNGTAGAGLCFNLQQQLGPHSPFAWFGRFGFGNEDIANGASAQVGTGFLFQGPLKHLVAKRTSNDLLGLAFVWSQPSATTKTVYHENEYVVETFYTVQLTPTIRLQPDLQFVFNPAFNPTDDYAMVGQLQLNMDW